MRTEANGPTFVAPLPGAISNGPIGRVQPITCGGAVSGPTVLTTQASAANGAPAVSVTAADTTMRRSLPAGNVSKEPRFWSRSGTNTNVFSSTSSTSFGNPR